MIIDELINSTKKGSLINILIDTILSLQQDEEILPKLIDVMLEVLWTFSFSISTNIHETLQKRVDLIQWLKTNLNDNSHLTSQAILYMLELNNKTLSKFSFLI